MLPTSPPKLTVPALAVKLLVEALAPSIVLPKLMLPGFVLVKAVEVAPIVTGPVYVWLPLVVMLEAFIVVLPVTLRDANDLLPPTMPLKEALPEMAKASAGVLASIADKETVEPVKVGLLEASSEDEGGKLLYACVPVPVLIFPLILPSRKSDVPDKSLFCCNLFNFMDLRHLICLISLPCAIIT